MSYICLQQQAIEQSGWDNKVVESGILSNDHEQTDVHTKRSERLTSHIESRRKKW
jgi:hypothetical protein